MTHTIDFQSMVLELQPTHAKALDHTTDFQVDSA